MNTKPECQLPGLGILIMTLVANTISLTLFAFTFGHGALRVVFNIIV